MAPTSSYGIQEAAHGDGPVASCELAYNPNEL